MLPLKVCALLCLLLPTAGAGGSTVQNKPEGLFDWRPVRLGAGGFVTGFITHPLDSNVRYCRTDVGNAYRWSDGEWRPMLVHAEGRGIPDSVAGSPAVCGVESIALDPSDPHVVYLAFTAARPAAFNGPGAEPPGNIFRSSDGGLSFTVGRLPVKMEPNGPWRTAGERLKVDPASGKVLYYGSVQDGLWRSSDAGASWRPVRGKGARPGKRPTCLRSTSPPARAPWGPPGSASREPCMRSSPAARCSAAATAARPGRIFRPARRWTGNADSPRSILPAGSASWPITHGSCGVISVASGRRRP